MSWLLIYDLKQDSDFVSGVQNATLTTRDFGIEPTHGLFGSDEWWHHIEDGTLPLHTLRGQIVQVYMGSMGDWPEFEILDEDGSLHQFTRYQSLPDGSLDHHYAVGRQVEVDFVWQEFRRDAPAGLPREGKTVTAIRIAA